MASRFVTKTSFETLLEMARWRARVNSQRSAFTFREDRGSEKTISFGQLDRRARAIAASLQRTTAHGDRAILVYPAGLDFVTAFMGCIYAGVIAVPATYPRPRKPSPRLLTIAADCRATVVLTVSQALGNLRAAHHGSQLQRLQWIATDTVGDEAGRNWNAPVVVPNHLALLQYTSGSTSDPKGVMVSHENLMSNMEMIRQGFDIDPDETDQGPGMGVSWLPAYHDMGLIGGILESIYVGGHTVLLSPASFMQQPVRWLRAISDYGAMVSGAPNFAYDLCVQKVSPEERATLDLSSWRVAFCGAEPIRPETIEEFAEAFRPCGFSDSAMYPCYGLAEATLMAAGELGPGPIATQAFRRSGLARRRAEKVDAADPDAVRLVGCGHALGNQEIAIVDPVTCERCPPDQVGEIWLKGPHVARGYWNRPDATRRTLQAKLAGDGEGAFLRTGDLGLEADGRIYVAGRLKDLIVIRGCNHYPQDIERTVEATHPALLPHSGAAVGYEDGPEERLLIVQEVNRRYRNAGLSDVVRQIRRQVSECHDLDVHRVVLIRQASIPRTTSGKVQRLRCRERLFSGDLKILLDWVKSSPGAPDGTKAPGGNGESAGGNGREKRGVKSPPEEQQVVPDIHESITPLQFDPSLRPLSGREIQTLTERIERWLLQWLVVCAGVCPEAADRDTPFAEFGIDSMTALQLSGELERSLHVRLTPVAAWNYPTPAALAEYLGRLAGDPESIEAEDDMAADGPVADFERILAEVENLSPEDVEAAEADPDDTA